MSTFYSAANVTSTDQILKQGQINGFNSSTTPLVASATFLGRWINVEDYANVIILVNSDVSGTLYFQGAMLNTDSTDTDGAWDTQAVYTYAGSTPSQDGALHALAIATKYIRLKYVNDGTNQTLFRLQCSIHKYSSAQLVTTVEGTVTSSSDASIVKSIITAKKPDTTYANIEANADCALYVAPKTDYRYEVAMGNITNVTTWNKFGYNNDVDVGTEVVAAQGGSFTPLTSASTLTIVSSSTDDDGSPAGIGCNSILITGVDANYDLQTELVTMNGTTNVVTSTTWLGINRVAVTLSGSSLGNVGNITITATTGGTVQAYLPAGESVTQQLIFFVRSGYTALMDWLVLNAEKISGGGNPKVTFKAWVFSQTTNTKYEVFRLVLDTQDQVSIQLNPTQPFVVGQDQCVWFEATSDTANTVVSGRFSLVEKINS